MTDRTEKLIAHILSHPDTAESGTASYKLLRQYQRGSPVESLRPLLSSPDERIAGEATWIASELPNAAVLLPEIGAVIKHASAKARFYALDCVLLWAGPSDGDKLAAAAALVDDGDDAVRWKAMGYLARVSHEQLAAALNYVRATDPESPHVNELTWLVSRQADDPREIIASLNSPDPRRRRMAAAAAFRLAKEEPSPLRYATSLEDPEIVRFAGDMLKIVSIG